MVKVPEINSEEAILPTYVALRSNPTNWVVLLAQLAGYQFLGSLKGLQIRAQYLGVGAGVFLAGQRSLPRGY